jgi:hypothetical protein
VKRQWRRLLLRRPLLLLPPPRTAKREGHAAIPEVVVGTAVVRPAERKSQPKLHPHRLLRRNRLSGRHLQQHRMKSDRADCGSLALKHSIS